MIRPAWASNPDSLTTIARQRHRGMLLTVDILSTFCGVFMFHCVKIILKSFEVGVLLFDCFVYQQLSGSFSRYKHYAGEVEDIITGKLVVVS